LKLLIVDDENHICDGIKKYIISKKYPIKQIKVASDGEEALSLIKEYEPDIVISDVVMPKKNGIQFANESMKLLGNTKFIMISGHDDPDLLKAAYKFRAYDYLFKPIDLEELDQVLTSVILECQTERKEQHQNKKLNEQLKETLPLYQEKQLMALLTNQLTESTEINRYLKEVGLAQADHYVVLCFYFSERPAYSIKEKIIEQIEKELPNPSFSFFEDERIVLSLLSFSKSSLSEMKSGYLYEVCTNIQARVFHKYQLEMTVGIGNEINRMENISVSYYQALEAVNQQFIRGYGKVIHYEKICSNTITPLRIELDVAMLKELIVGNVEEAKLSVLLKEFYEIPWISKEAVQQIRLELCAFIVHMTNMSEPSKGVKTEQFHNLLFEMMQLQTLLEIENSLLNYLEVLQRSLKNSKAELISPIVVKNLEIVEDKYMESLSIQQISKELNVSPNYLSSLFKKEIGMNFVEYLTQYRLRKSIELMNDSSLKLYEIAGKVGYEDENYYSKVFRKYYHMSPSEFRGIQR
jgi:two-component system response regulator YesN